MLKSLLRLRGGADTVAERLYVSLVAQARQHEFFQELGVPDSVLGRFEMICIHAFLLFRRLKDTEAGALAQDVHDVMFADMDRSLREMGVGDLGVGKRVKKLASNFYGRLAAYDEGLAGDDRTLAAALKRNLYATAEVDDRQVMAVAGYVRREAEALDRHDAAAIQAGEIAFGPAPVLSARVPVDTRGVASASGVP